uniref:Uncharacterized protein n=1 Tax=Knipowitschia caucasica TaxID=637954 RepID=A0AAV2KRY6_KNICA
MEDRRKEGESLCSGKAQSWGKKKKQVVEARRSFLLCFSAPPFLPPLFRPLLLPNGIKPAAPPADPASPACPFRPSRFSARPSNRHPCCRARFALITID